MGKARDRTLASDRAARPAVVLDAGALLAFERADERMRALLVDAIDHGTRLVIPAGVLARVWREPARQGALGALLRGPTTVVVALDQALAEAAGVLCSKRKTSDGVAASVVLTARREGAPIVTSDPEGLRHLDKGAELHRI